MRRTVCVTAVVVALAAGSAAGELPEKLRDAAANTWVKLSDETAGDRSSPGLVWAGRERSFVCFGGRMDMLPKHKSPYSEMTLNLKARRWENRFPKGKLGVWGERTGPAKAPQFAGSYYAVRMKDTEGNVRPYLGSGYDRAMYLYNNYACDHDRGRVVVAWHLGAFTAEYDPVERTWEVVDSAPDVPDDFWDDFLWGAMCYDPVNKEVLGGRGRWVYSTKTRKWRRLETADKRLDPLRERAEALRVRAKDLVGAARSRYYVSQTPQEAAVKLDEVASGIEQDAAVLGGEQELSSARARLREAADLLRGEITPEAIGKLEDARDGFERCVLSLSAAPPPRAMSPMVYDAANRKIVLFGGDRQDRKLADTWVYDCPTRTWRQRRPRLSPPPRAGHGLVYLPKARKVLLVDGYGIGKSGRSWIYDTAANEWSLLAEGGGDRPVITARPHYSFMPGPMAASEDDLVVLVTRCEEFRGGPRRGGTWAARIDATRLDAAGTKKLGVGPLTMSVVAKSLNPRWYEAHGPAPAPGADKVLDSIPPNTWVRVTPPNNPRLNRAWGTTVLDTARDQIIQWGGGHAAYSGNDVLHYSIKTNRCSTGSFFPEFALNWNCSMLFPPMPTTFGGRPYSQHAYHNYGFDPVSKKIIALSRSAGRFFVYDPLKRDWQGRVGPRFARIGQPGGAKQYQNITCVPAPSGLVAWTPDRGLLGLHTWKQLPLEGKLPAMHVDSQAMTFDSKRDRLLLFSRKLQGKVAAYDMATGEMSMLDPSGADGVTYRPRESVYVTHADGVLVGAVQGLANGKQSWLYYDCAKNAWLAVHLPGAKVSVGFGLGLMYDPKRRLVWAADSRLTLAAMRLELKTAQTRVLSR